MLLQIRDVVMSDKGSPKIGARCHGDCAWGWQAVGIRTVGAVNSSLSCSTIIMTQLCAPLCASSR